jgi:hypothetical protein
MPGAAAVAMWWDVPPEVRAEWEEWHTYEHMPERLSIPGFLRGSRWISGECSYFVLYETADLATITSGPYLERLNNPSPWSRKMMPHHHNMVRSLCLVRASHGGGVPHALATLRFSPGEELPQLPSGQGVTGAQLLQAQPMPQATEEQRIRGGDATADWVLLVGGYDADAVRRVAEEQALPGATRGLYRLSYSLSKP